MPEIRKKPAWKKFKFWFPIVTGLVTSGSFALKFLFDVEIPDAVLGWLIVGGLTLIGAILGVEWDQLDEMK